MQVKKVQTSVGSISKVENKPVWDIHRIVNELGDDFVMKHGEVKLTKLQEWIQIGAFPKELLSAHQQVVDIGLKFVVMSLEAENRAFNAYQFRRRQLSV